MDVVAALNLSPRATIDAPRPADVTSPECVP
jgi:hypothetical protein